MLKRAVIAPGVTPDQRPQTKQAVFPTVREAIKRLDRDFTKAAASRMQAGLAHGS